MKDPIKDATITEMAPFLETDQSRRAVYMALRGLASLAGARPARQHRTIRVPITHHEPEVCATFSKRRTA